MALKSMQDCHLEVNNAGYFSHDGISFLILLTAEISVSEVRCIF